MATKIKDQATAEKAALKLNEGIEKLESGEPNAPHEKTTTEKLFPDFIDEKTGIIINRPIIKESPTLTPIVPATATSAPASQGQTNPTQAPTIPAYITEKDLAGKMAKLKVDGIEQDVPASELFKISQLERHSNAQLMKIAQERAQLERERQELLAKVQSPSSETKPAKMSEPLKKSPEIEVLEAKLAAMEQQFAQERALMLPQIQEAGIKRVEQMAKDRGLGDDYRNYHEKIRDAAFAELAKPENATNPQARYFFDSDNFYFQKFQELKLKDVLSKLPSPATTNPNVPVLQTQTGAPIVVNNNGQAVSVPSIESASGVPSRTNPSADWQGTYNALLSRAQKEPTQENWMALMRHKFSRET